MEVYRDSDKLEAAVVLMIVVYVSAILAVAFIMAALLWIMAISERFPSWFSEKGDKDAETGEIGVNLRTPSISKCK